MKCDQALDALATGGPVQRWLAARHLARCPKCSEQAKALGQIVEALSDLPPLTYSEQQSWMKAADEAPLVREVPGWHALAKREHATRPRIPIAIRVPIAVAYLAMILWLGHWIVTHPNELRMRPIVAARKPPVFVAIDPAVIKQTTLRDLDTLQGKTSSLSRELDDLLREVNLLDARRDVEALQLQFASVGERLGP